MTKGGVALSMMIGLWMKGTAGPSASLRFVEKHPAGSELRVADPRHLALYQGTTLVVPPQAK
jgi:hypothetical protein